MKTKNLLKILILFILAGTIANAEYFKENGEVYYKMPYLEIKSKVKGADAKTLENVGEDNMVIAGYFGKDSKNVYFIGEKIKDVSPKGFEILDAKYVKDDKNLYKLEDKLSSYFSSNEIKTKKVSIDCAIATNRKHRCFLQCMTMPTVRRSSHLDSSFSILFLMK